MLKIDHEICAVPRQAAKKNHSRKLKNPSSLFIPGDFYLVLTKE